MLHDSLHTNFIQSGYVTLTLLTSEEPNRREFNSLAKPTPARMPLTRRLLATTPLNVDEQWPSSLRSNSSLATSQGCGSTTAGSVDTAVFSLAERDGRSDGEASLERRDAH